MNEITATTAVIGMVNGINFLLEGNYKSFGKFFIALLFGVVFGYLGWFGLNGIEQGLAIALSSSGVYKITQILTEYGAKTTN